MSGSLVPSAPAVRLPKAPRKVAPLRHTYQADLLIVAPFSLSKKLLTAVSRLPGVTATERVEAVRLRVNGKFTAVLGVNPSGFRSFAARPTGASNTLWQGVADGGIAVSYTMGKLDHLPLGGTVTLRADDQAAARGGVRHAGHRRGRRRGLQRGSPLARRAGRQRDRHQHAQQDFTGRRERGGQADPAWRRSAEACRAGARRALVWRAPDRRPRAQSRQRSSTPCCGRR